MPTSRRTLVLIALGLTAAAFGVGLVTRPDPAPIAIPERQARGPAGDDTQAMEVLQIGAARSQSVRATVGRPLRLTVEGAGTTDVVLLDGLDQQAQVSPELPAVFDLLPDRAGTYAIVLASSKEPVGALRVSADD